MLSALSRSGPTSAHPMSRSGPTASNAALPYPPATSGYGNVQRQGYRAGEDQQSAGWPQLCRCRPCQSQLSNAEEEPEDREVDGGRDEGSDPGRYAQAEREVEDVAEPEHEGEADNDAHDHGDRLNDRGST
jgi:hypothetical protein